MLNAGQQVQAARRRGGVPPRRHGLRQRRHGNRARAQPAAGARRTRGARRVQGSLAGQRRHRGVKLVSVPGVAAPAGQPSPSPTHPTPPVPALGHVQARPNVKALFVPAEIVTYCFYPGLQRDYMVANAIFRMVRNAGPGLTPGAHGACTSHSWRCVGVFLPSRCCFESCGLTAALALHEVQLLALTSAHIRTHTNRVARQCCSPMTRAIGARPSMSCCTVCVSTPGQMMAHTREWALREGAKQLPGLVAGECCPFLAAQAHEAPHHT